MSKRLILHIGTHKTGTSSLQSYFSFFREETESLGLGYPSIPAMFRYKFPNKQHKFLAREGFKDKNHEIVAEWLHQLKSSEHDNLLSSETFWRIGQQNNSVSRHKSGSFLTRNKKSIAKLKELLKDFDVSIHVFLRRQDLLITSLHKGAVMRGSKINELNLPENTIECFNTYTSAWSEIEDLCPGYVSTENKFNEFIIRDLNTRVRELSGEMELIGDGFI